MITAPKVPPTPANTTTIVFTVDDSVVSSMRGVGVTTEDVLVES